MIQKRNRDAYTLFHLILRRGYMYIEVHKNERKLALRLLSVFITGFQLYTRSTGTKCHEWSRRQADASELAYVRLRRTHHRARRGKDDNDTTHKAHNPRMPLHPRKTEKQIYKTESIQARRHGKKYHISVDVLGEPRTSI